MSCKHPDSLRYNVGLAGLYEDDIFWCRMCGSISGWKPADNPADGDWQPPVFTIERDHAEEHARLGPRVMDEPRVLRCGYIIDNSTNEICGEPRPCSRHK